MQNQPKLPQHAYRRQSASMPGPSGCPVELTLSYASRLLLSACCSALPIAGAQAQNLSCSGSNPVVCTNGAGQNLNSPVGVTNSGTSNLQVTNNANLGVNSSSPVGVAVYNDGRDGSSQEDDEVDGTRAYDVTLTNNGTVTLGLNGSTGNAVSGVRASSRGGVGATPPHHDDGGMGGSGAPVTLTNNAAVSVNQLAGGIFGKGAMGVYAESAGGNGAAPNAAVIDYYGGNGSGAGIVTLTNNGEVSLGSAAAPLVGSTRMWGVAAESFGGNGGDYAKNEVDPGTPSGAGGGGGVVTVNNFANVSVYWAPVAGNSTSDGIAGVIGRSLGGVGGYSDYTEDGGGNSGFASQVSINVGQANLAQTVVTVNSTAQPSGMSAGVLGISRGGVGGDQHSHGADGGAGGYAGQVGIQLENAAVKASGDNVAGVIAFSRGGDGGSAQDSDGETAGGTGGLAGAVSIALDSAATPAGQGSLVSTNGKDAYGLLAQSVGGFGGTGTSHGGAGQDAEIATITTQQYSVVQATGSYAAGIVAQSIGGGGGTGTDFTIGLGGSGGNGGNGGNGVEATINNAGGVMTRGDYGYGLLAQSIGGSGGSGGSGVGLIVALGGTGGAGGGGGTVTVNNTGAIQTDGYGATGVTGQSIGGGGGAAGAAAGAFAIGGSVSNSQSNNGATVTITNAGGVSTRGNAAIGLLGQSIGGGGGSAASAAGLLSIGGTGAVGGNGGTVTVNANGSQTTQGNYSHGAVAQSIGGGGGNGGDAFAITTALPTPAIGGSAGGGGDGGNVTMTAGNLAVVSTVGDGAAGMLAQSVGGGGGSGGSAMQTSLFAPVSVAIGGQGGGGGNAGTVTLQASGALLSTNGASAAGLIAQSVGGGGGNGGAAMATDLNLGLSLGVGVGGSGGAGGNGSKVSVTLDNTRVGTGGQIPAPSNPPASQVVNQADSYGVLAQSIGGGGGNGGSVVSRTIALPVPISEDATFAMASSVTVGGHGGDGGDGDEVDLWLSGNSVVATAGQGSHAVLAQSVGGGGGNGGDSNAMSRTVTIEDTSIAVNVDVAVGGFGGTSGDAGLVNLQLADTTQITTVGDYSNGLMGQAIGGGGGNGGVGSSGTGGIAKDKSYTVNVGVGGKGKAGGNGGQVEASLAQGTSIKTSGSGSRGILLQSIGGGGGASQGTTVSLGAPFSSGGDGDSDATTSFSASVSVSVGEQGGAGGSGSTVTLSNAGTIVTSGKDADGMLLQSIGGGGGLGGSAGSDASAGPSSYPSGGNNPDDPPPSNDNNLGSYGLSVAVGGKGGGGGSGGTVSWNYTGNTVTAGDLADAVVVQSIGGGGGTGGTSAAKGAKGDGNIMVSVGGSGGSAGDGGEIDLNPAGKAGTKSNVALSGLLVTRGNVAYGLLAQSIGGGGGQGADGSADLTYKTLSTPSLMIGVNGSGGNGGKGGAIKMNAANSLIGATTFGRGSHAIVLQSIGGGGGAGSLASSDSATIEGTGLSLQLGGGGNGAASGGGAITVDSVVLTNTFGHGAYGFVAQSIGGGGGIAYAGQAANINGAMIDNSQRSASYDASGGLVSVTLNSALDLATGDPYYDIHTAGSAAHGIVLQSIGGGGGIAGDPGASPLRTGWWGGSSPSQSAGNAGGGDISLTLGAGLLVQVNGDNSYGVVLQSVADGGGLGGTAQGSFAGSAHDHSHGGGSRAGSITFTQGASGMLLAYGSNPVGVFAQSDGSTAQASPITLNINGIVQTTTSDPNGIGLWLDKGSSANTVNVNHGWISSTTAVKQTGSGVTTLNNVGGTVSGSLFLSADDSDAVGAVYNRGALLNAQTVKATVFNDGEVIVGAPSRIDAMRVSNDFRQSDAGTLHVDADFAGGQADTLSVAGLAQLGGRVQINAQTLMPNRELAFLRAGSLNSTAAVGGASSLFDFSTRHTGHSASVTARNAYFNDFSSKYGVGSNLREVGSHLQDIWDAGGSAELGSLYAQFDRAAAGQAPGYTSALKDLSPGPSAAPAALATGAMKGFSDTLFSCPSFGPETARIAESNCAWGRVVDKTVRLDAGRGTSATKSDATSYQLGGQQRIAPDWLLGMAGAYEHSTIHSNDGRTHSKGDAGYLGAVLKYETGPWTLSGATYGSYGTYDNQRQIALTGAQAKSDSKVWSIGQQFRAAYTYATDNAYIKPYASVDVIYTRMPSYEERGAGPLNLKVRGSDNVTALFTPGVEVGGRFDLDHGFTARPYANAGVSLASSDKWDSQAQLAAAPAGSRSFKTTLDTGRVFGRASVGVQLSSRRGFDLQLQYDLVASDRVRSSGGAVKATWRY